MDKQGESGKNIGKQDTTGRIRGKHRKIRENRANQKKTYKYTGKPGESGKNIAKQDITGRIRGKHRKTRENKANRRKT